MKIDNKITIYYFSATGNSLKAAMDITSQYKDSELIKITQNEKIKYTDSKIIGFVFPVYAGTLPDIVRSFLINFEFRKETYIFTVCTYYGYKGTAFSVVNQILKNKGAYLNYSNSIYSVGSCLMEYEVSEKKRISILKQSDEKIKTIVSDIANQQDRKSPKYCKLSENIHRKLFKMFFGNAYRKFTLEDSCISCGICKKVCPVNNISNVDKKPQWGQNCIACHAFVQWCPKNAITLGRSKGRLQYHNPNINVGAIIK